VAPPPGYSLVGSTVIQIRRNNGIGSIRANVYRKN
jgi:hypothetical protein